jgi:hypothetical protein
LRPRWPVRRCFCREQTQTIICGGRKWRWVMLLLAANHGPSSLFASSSLHPMCVVPHHSHTTKLSRNAVFFAPCGSMHRIPPCRVLRSVWLNAQNTAMPCSAQQGYHDLMQASITLLSSLQAVCCWELYLQT